MSLAHVLNAPGRLYCRGSCTWAGVVTELYASGSWSKINVNILCLHSILCQVKGNIHVEHLTRGYSVLSCCVPVIRVTFVIRHNNRLPPCADVVVLFYSVESV